ncbi:MAG: ComF family protein [Patescibacteria group bacterium]
MKIREFFSWMLDFVFPRACLGCGKNEGYLCKECLKQFFEYKNQCCPNCRKWNENGVFCSLKCRSGLGFDQLLVCVDYLPRSLIQKLITTLKYKFIREISQDLGRILLAQFAYHSHKFPKDNLVILPVPSHKSRVRFRSFNQAELLARYIAEHCKIGFGDYLERIEQTETQAHSNREERLENLKGVVRVKEGFLETLKGKTVLLIDDVATTGSTMQACSEALKQAGVKYICGLVVARAPLRYRLPSVNF